jgi:hypothetical protein
VTNPSPWDEVPDAVAAGIEVVFTDVDDTVTRDGRLHGATLDAMEALGLAGVRVVPVTAASAGWGSAMIAMWPVAALFAHLPHSVGVATVARRNLTHPPRWITQGGGGTGFVQVAERILAARRCSNPPFPKEIAS